MKAANVLRTWVNAVHKYQTTVISLQHKRRICNETEMKAESRKKAIDSTLGSIDNHQEKIKSHRFLFDNYMKMKEDARLKVKKMRSQNDACIQLRNALAFLEAEF